MEYLPTPSAALQAALRADLKTVLSTVGYILGLAFVTNCIYNRYFHPLAHFPGPFWATITDFYKLYRIALKDAQIRGLEQHRKYGPIVRVAPNKLSFSDPKLIPIVYARKANKTPFYTPAIFGENILPLQTLDYAEHAAKRKRIADVYSMTNLRKTEAKIDARILELMTTFEERYASSGEAFDYSPWVIWFTYDTVTSLGFGHPIGFVKESRDVWGLLQAVYDMVPYAGVISSLPWLVKPILNSKRFRYLLMPYPNETKRGTGKVMAACKRIINDHLKKPNAGKTQDSYLDKFLQAKNADGTPLSIEDVRAECLVFMIAGSATSPGFINPFLYNIVSRPAIYSKLRAEISEFEKASKLSSPIVSYDETNQMPYFMACVWETLRCNPSTPQVLPRFAPQGGMEYDGKHIPETAEIGANPYIVQRWKPLYGEDADEFRPERWIEATPEYVAEMQRNSLAFGYGPRICLGKSMAQLETQKFCLELFRRFDIELTYPERGWNMENWGISFYFDNYINIKKHTPAS